MKLDRVLEISTLVTSSASMPISSSESDADVEQPARLRPRPRRPCHTSAD